MKKIICTVYQNIGSFFRECEIYEKKLRKKNLEKIEELFMVHACKVAISCLFIHNGARASLKFYLIF